MEELQKLKMANDDIYIVVIGDTSIDSPISLPTQIKDEFIEEDEELVEDSDDNVTINNSIVDEECIMDSDEYLPDSDDQQSGPSCSNIVASHRKRTKMLKHSERQSYVKYIKDNYPDLKDNQKLLINCLVALMKSMKVPELPMDYYIMNGIMLECLTCGFQSETIQAAGRHYQERHGSRYLFCLACGVDFRSRTSLYKHEKRCESRDAVFVLKARAIFLGRKGRSRPYLPKFPNVKEAKRFNCTQCSASFTSKFSLTAHQHMHTGVRPYRCPMCPRAYTSNSTLSRHLKKHGDQRYICDICQKSFNVKATLIVHMNTHQPLKRFACEECPKRYAQRAALLLHVNREHRGLPPPCACKLCPKRFPRMSVLKEHMRKVHGMSLMTRKMFMKSLPTLSDSQLARAKVVMKDELDDPVGYTIERIVKQEERS